jgi:hypothetical protein
MGVKRTSSTRPVIPKHRTTSTISILFDLLALLAAGAMFNRRLDCQLNIPDDFANRSCTDPQYINPLRIYPHQIYNSNRPVRPGYYRRYIVNSTGTGYSDVDELDDGSADRVDTASDITSLRHDQDPDGDPDQDDNDPVGQQEMSGGLMHEPPAIRAPSQDWMSGAGAGARLSIGHERGDR